MPEFDGFYLLNSLQEHNIKTNVIVLSADIQDSTKEKVMSYNVKAFLNKPPKEDKLMSLLKELLS